MQVEDLSHTCPHCGSTIFTMSGDAKALAATMMQQQEAARHVDQSHVYFKQKRFRDAESELKRALELNPQNSMATGNMGYLLLALDRPKEAIEWFEKTLQLNPNHPTARSALEKARGQVGKSASKPSDSQFTKESKGCFIATACYGSADCVEVREFRRFRDEILVSNWWGRKIVGLYYRFSPPIAAILRRKSILRAFVRRYFLMPIFKLIRGK